MWPGPVNTNLEPGPVNTNSRTGLLNTNWGPGPVNTNWGPGPLARKYKFPPFCPFSTYLIMHSFVISWSTGR